MALHPGNHENVHCLKTANCKADLGSSVTHFVNENGEGGVLTDCDSVLSLIVSPSELCCFWFNKVWKNVTFTLGPGRTSSPRVACNPYMQWGASMMDDMGSHAEHPWK